VVLCDLIIKFTNSLRACCGSSGQKTQYDLMMLAYHCFTSVLLLIYGSLFLSGVYYSLSVFRCAFARISELEEAQQMNIRFVKLYKSGSKIREMLVQV
jgi:hypothetical protein